MPAKDDDEDYEKTGIYAEYFQITDEYRAKYGERMVLLMQVGSFFEVYGMKNTENSIVMGSVIVSFAQICQLVVSEKTTQYQNHAIVMSGFRDYALEKYLQKITENGYTAVVYVQEKVGKKVRRRVFHSVHSPGTYVPYENEVSMQTSNNIMCIWFEKYTSPVVKKMQVACGIAVCNIFTGKSSIFEYNTPWMLNPTTFDELERCLATHSPSEVIVIHPFDENTLQSVLQYSGINRVHLIHRIHAEHETVKRGSTQKYIKHILSAYFGDDSYMVCEEFAMNTIATQAFCYLLHFVQEHNPNLVRKINLPDFDGTTDSRVLLVNHTLKQLNIIDDASTDGRQCGKYSSVLRLLNKCCTAMGRRLFQSHLLMPSYDEVWLNREYAMIDYMLSKDKEMVVSLRKVLHEVVDIEKVCRQIVLCRIYPSSVYNLFKSVNCIHQINMCLYECPEACVYFGQTVDFVNDTCVAIREYIERTLVINECAGLNSLTTFPACIIQRGVSSELDALIDDRNVKMEIYAGIRDGLNRLIQKHMKTITDVDYVKEHETDKLGLSLQITSKRGQMLKTALDWLKTQPNPHIDVHTGGGTIQVHSRDI
jgi:DNA mismatch repair protein MutS